MYRDRNNNMHKSESYNDSNPGSVSTILQRENGGDEVITSKHSVDNIAFGGRG